jgi:hypothetical protein
MARNMLYIYPTPKRLIDVGNRGRHLRAILELRGRSRYGSWLTECTLGPMIGAN